MLGKKAARAAPMMALADCSACSAARTSGRRASTSEGMPACRLGHHLRLVERQRRREVGGQRAPDQEDQGVLGPGPLQLGRGQVEPGRLDLGLGAAEVQLGDPARPRRRAA